MAIPVISIYQKIWQARQRGASFPSSICMGETEALFV